MTAGELEQLIYTLLHDYGERDYLIGRSGGAIVVFGRDWQLIVKVLDAEWETLAGQSGVWELSDLIAPSVARGVTPHREEDGEAGRAPAATEDLPARSELFDSSGASIPVSTGREADARAKRTPRVGSGSDGLAGGVEVGAVHERVAEPLGVLVEPVSAAPVAELVLGDPGGVQVRTPLLEAESAGDVAGFVLAHGAADGAWPFERDERELRHWEEG